MRQFIIYSFFGFILTLSPNSRAEETAPSGTAQASLTEGLSPDAGDICSTCHKNAVGRPATWVPPKYAADKVKNLSGEGRAEPVRPSGTGADAVGEGKQKGP